MKLYKKMLMVFIVINLVVLLFPVGVKGQFADLNYTFNSDLLMNETNPSYNETYNTKDSEIMNLGTYPASYSFTNENGSIGTNIDFIDYDNELSGTLIIVAGEKVEHKKVLKYYDTSATNQVNGYNSFTTPQISGIIEWWWLVSDTTKTVETRLLSASGIIALRLSTLTDTWQYDNSGSFTDSGITALDNVWYHHKVEFDSSTDLFSWWINGRLVIDDAGYRAVTNDIGRFSCVTKGTDTNVAGYYDGIGYSWGKVLETENFSSYSIDSVPTGWIDNSDANCEATIQSIPAQNLHKALDFSDASATGKANMSRSLPENTGAIELDMSMNVLVDTQGYFRLYLDEVVITSVSFQADDLYARNGTTLTQVLSNFNHFYAITTLKVVLDFDLEIYDIYANGSLVADDFGFQKLHGDGSAIDEINRIEFVSGVFPSSYDFFVDNISFIDTYNSGDNLIPELELIEGYLEVDKYEFALSGVNTLKTIDSSDYGTWTESDSGGHNTVNIQLDSTDSDNRVVNISTYNMGDVKGLIKNNFTLTGDFIEITAGIEFIDFAGTTSYNLFTFKSSDTSTIAGLIMWHNGSLGYFQDIDDPGTPLRDDLTTGEFYEFSLMLDYEIDVFILEWYIDGVYDETYIFPLIETGKSGLEYMGIGSHWVDNLATILVYYVGVYGNGVSECYENAWVTIDSSNNQWDSIEQNIFSITGNGVISVGMTVFPYSITAGSPFGLVNGFEQVYSNTTENYNTIEDTHRTLGDSQIIFYFFNGSFNISYVDISGVKMNQGANEYLIEYTHGGIDIDQSYFYVDSSNRLRFKHYADDSGLEFIQASFDILNRSSDDSTIGWTSDRNDNALGYFRVQFNGTSNLFEMPPYLNTRKVIMTQDRTIDKLVILITDNGFIGFSGSTTGYITGISIQYSQDIIASVVTLNLVGMMIPLILILVPTILLSERFGRQLIIPLFIVFSIIAVITSTIPIWLFFIIAISSSLFIFTRKNEEVM